MAAHGLRVDLLSKEVQILTRSQRADTLAKLFRDGQSLAAPKLLEAPLFAVLSPLDVTPVATARVTLVSGKPLNLPYEPYIGVLVQEISSSRGLTIYAGAGISTNSDLPRGSELARSVHESFNGEVSGYCCSTPDDLHAVADAIASLPGGRELLQNRIVELAPFESATPSLGHKLLALLILEGAIRVVTTNWDTCIERGWVSNDQRIEAARDSVETEEQRRSFLIKTHGCATRPSTILVTNDDLQSPPLWTQGVSASIITSSTLVFLGVSAVASYVREPIQALGRYVPGSRIRVVSPSVIDKWAKNKWDQLLPEISPDRRIPMSSDTFADELARSWVKMRLISRVRQSAVRDYTKVLNAFQAFTALEALSWLRKAAHQWPVGKAVAESEEASSTLKAIEVLSTGQSPVAVSAGTQEIRFAPDSAVYLGDTRVDVLLFRESVTATQVEQVAQERVSRLSLLPRDAIAVVLCSAAWVEGPLREVVDGPDVLLGEGDPGDIITGPSQTPFRIISAAKLLGEAT